MTEIALPATRTRRLAGLPGLTDYPDAPNQSHTPPSRRYAPLTPFQAQPIKAQDNRVPPTISQSAFVSKEFADEDDYYNANLGATDLDPPPEDYGYQIDSTYGYCYVGIVDCDSGTDEAEDNTSPPALPLSTYLSTRIESPTSMARLYKLPIRPFPTTIENLVELCRGGRLAGLSAALANGITIKTVALLEMARYMATARLRSSHPATSSPKATQSKSNRPSLQGRPRCDESQCGGLQVLPNSYRGVRYTTM